MSDSTKYSNNLPTFCPSCLNEDCVIHIDLGDECDSDGTFGNHRCVCSICGRCTCDMDTFEDAVEAFSERGDVVHFNGADTVLLPIDLLRQWLPDGTKLTMRDIISCDVRNREG